MIEVFQRNQEEITKKELNTYHHVLVEGEGRYEG
jgi:hypothetical protein